MQFGIIPCSSWPVEQASANKQFQHTLEQAMTAADEGYDALWAGQHYLREDLNGFQPITLLSRYTAFADDMDLGTSIFLLPLHNPIMVAEHFASIDQSFDGDLNLGVALGYKPSEFDNFGIDMSDRVGRLVESIQIIRKLWSQNEVTYSGDHFQLEDATIHPKTRGDTLPKIWMGANQATGVKRAGKLGDGWIMSARTSYDNALGLSDVYREAATDGEGNMAMNREVFVADTTDEAMDIARPAMKNRVQHWLKREAQDTKEEIDDIDEKVDELLEERIVGDPEECIDRIAKYRDNVGIDHLICMYNWRTIPNEKMVESIKIFGQEVIPYFRESP